MSNSTSPISEANDHYQAALDLKSKGQFDAALTLFRRAAIADPHFSAAHMEIGRLCKDKARLDRVYLRHTYDAFRQAAKLDPNLQEAHDEYIIIAQKMGQLDKAHDEYEQWTKQFPENEIIKRAYKNIVAISMAITTRVDIQGTKASGTLKKMVFFLSFGTILLGLGLIFVPPMFSKTGKVTKNQIGSFLKVGVVMSIFGIGGILFQRRLD